MWTHKWLRMSWWNALITLAVLVAAAVLALTGQWPLAVGMGLVGVVTAASAIYARSGRASDITRLNALEALDERDRAMTSFALSVVGVAGLMLTLVVFFAAMALLEPGHPMFWVVWGQTMAMAAVWIVTNYVATRRH